MMEFLENDLIRQWREEREQLIAQERLARQVQSHHIPRTLLLCLWMARWLRHLAHCLKDRYSVAHISRNTGEV